MSAATTAATREPVHIQAVDGFGTVTLTPVDPAADAPLIHRWVSEDRARFWGMAGASPDLVREVYEDLDRRTTHHAFLARRDGVPVALFQTYECAADRVSECYEARPGDTGVHLLLAPAPGAAEPGFSGRLMGAFMAFVLADGTTRRLVADPDTRNAKAIARLERSGFTLGPEVELPEIVLPEIRIPAKRARLAFLEAPGTQSR
ncbi:siderophore biosynthesis protein [Streptomyces globosus]|uniref:Lysine N-acyltransferase MbtK n=1 Tax=Streptomyces globosus TaxID=68209 RepID=A0A344TWU0_9ACTN|nr:GNAT family N-acetyltransferase [Streptomyces globosus]AXE23111.1 siderophore biosynthesis protein [Streptomyces globosus]